MPIRVFATTHWSVVLAAVAGGTARVWEVQTARPLFALGGHSKGVLQVAWSSDGQWIATGGQDKNPFKTTYENPRPDAEVVSINFVSRLTQATPFFVGLTVE